MVLKKTGSDGAKVTYSLNVCSVGGQKSEFVPPCNPRGTQPFPFCRGGVEGGGLGRGEGDRQADSAPDMLGAGGALAGRGREGTGGLGRGEGDEGGEGELVDSGEVKAIGRRTVHQICSGQVVLSLAVAVKELVEVRVKTVLPGLCEYRLYCAATDFH